MKSLSKKLTAMILVICLVGMGLLAGISVALFRRSLIQTTLEEIGLNTAWEAERINGWLERQVSYIGSLAVEYSYLEDYSDEAMLPRLNSHVDAVEEYFDVYMGYPDGRVTFASGFVPDYAAGWASTKRPWYIGAMIDPEQVHITELYTDVQTGELCLTIAKAVIKDGEVIGVVSADVLINHLTDIVHEADVGEDSYAFLVSGEGDIFIYPGDAYGPDTDDVFQKLYEVEDGLYADIWRQASGGAVRSGGYYYTARTIPAADWMLFTAIPSSVVASPVRGLILIECVIFVAVLLAAGVMISLSVRRMIVRPIADLTRAADELTRGGLDIRIDQEYDDEIGELIRSFTVMADSIREQAGTTERLAGGNLVQQVAVRSEGDVMGRALQHLNRSLSEFIAQIAQASERVSSGSDQISDSTQMLADGATKQAAAVQDVFLSVSEMVKQIKLTEEIAGKASAESGAIVENAKNGTERMERMIQAVEDINEASNSISKVIKAIDDIAFQTNILALNAAVEAARAGQHGKGFAVVADEVRNLAGKSAEAARETDAMIKDSILRASDGTRIARETSESLQEILAGIGSAFELVDKINAATREQAEFIDRIHDGVEQINAVVAENAATSEECAASVHELSQEATAMMEIVRNFSGAKMPAAPVAEPPAAGMDYPPMLSPENPESKY